MPVDFDDLAQMLVSEGAPGAVTLRTLHELGLSHAEAKELVLRKLTGDEQSSVHKWEQSLADALERGLADDAEEP